ncbi:protein IMPAIRED IN BABA-INDUCED STERILITY 1 [Populus alba]|uniref:Protein IMPAIRED IN BABA-INDUCEDERILITY 1-like n=2 Tax=Populus TaxID=3689 RepID=A0AAD6PY66_9ROSI|nr:protein IMPAIRED IN BABA-INDUCED STERILITY 1-like [Populus alba]KAJ6970283.1 protein IMPAIRED IN BABA-INDUCEDERILITY 1-like [Populus alba x Populus x berolinensis]TKS16129.1 putative serine/threonine-protein kinase [Populus alba]
MGCVSSKQAVSVTPALDHSVLSGSGRARVGMDQHPSFKKNGDHHHHQVVISCGGSELGESGRAPSSNGESVSFRLRSLHKYIEGEQVAAGWPAWLSAVAGEAIHGWVPLKADAFEKLEKIGQGTYSSVFRARETETGRIVALKKVRFDNFEPESVRFMAREILILRRLDHPNIMKLDGLITSRLSCSIYLVFEYMEHDITGLLSCADVRFSEAQIKCYMKQLISGLDHCHSKGVMHRDIKGSNLLVNNDGILKIGDFGLANFCTYGHRQPLTSRVVTLWYRPPELLLGSTDYGASVDLWSVGCVFAELLLGKPILQGRTEVEQLHKIFKLCGSPPDEYWKKSKVPHATLFKPQQPYDSCLRETLKDLPTTAVNLIKTLLSVEPYKRGTASSALASEYFSTKPYPCDPSSLPKYPPSKEIDAKNREEARRKKIGGRGRGTETRKCTRKLCGISKLAAEDLSAQKHCGQINISNMRVPKGGDGKSSGEARKPSLDKLEEIFHIKNASQGDIPFSGPLKVPSSSGFAWAKRRKDDASIRSHSRSTSRGHSNNILEPSSALQQKTNSDTKGHDNGDLTHGIRTNSRGHDSYEISKLALRKQWRQFERPDSFDASEEYHSQELSLALYQREGMEARGSNLVFQDQVDKVDFSGPLLSQTHRVDELLERHERHIRQAVRKSWFQSGKKHGK